MKRAFILLALSAGMAGVCPAADWFKVSQRTLQGAIIADAVTTEAALARPGVYEANPFQQSRVMRLGSHAGLAVGLPWIESHTALKHHRRVAIVLNFGLAVGFGVISGSNVRLAQWGK